MSFGRRKGELPTCTEEGCGETLIKQIGMGMAAWRCPNHGDVIGAKTLAASDPKRSTPEERDEQTEFYRGTVAGGGYKCAVSGQPYKERGRRDPLRIEAHHVIDQQILKANGLSHVLWDPDNGLPVTAAVHAAHTSAMRRIPRSALRPANLVFARRHDLLHIVEQKYPDQQGG